MKITKSWLADWIALPHDGEALAEQLTMAGLEVDAVTRLRPGFSGVVVARIAELAPHPDADKLRVAQVDAGDGSLRQVVCGAANARVGLVTALACVGGRLPGDVKIRQAKLRGVASAGMLCSAAELGLDDEASGIVELPTDAPIGADLGEWLALEDTIIDVDLTPNRGDCFSVLGIARELAALNDANLGGPALSPVPAGSEDRFAVTLAAPQACARFAARVVRGIDASVRSPVWLSERLRRAGLRAIHPVVDVTNYVMLELGQPLHGYDLGQLSGAISVRMAEAAERLTLLDGREIALEPDMLVIADDSGAIGLAGIMGGQSTAVSAETRDVLLEAAWFAPSAIAGRARRLGLHTDASLRFERGVDPEGPSRAIERATALLVEIAGGTPGPVNLVEAAAHLPARQPVSLRAARLAKVLGIDIPALEVERIFSRLGMQATATGEGWQVRAPSQRFDIQIEVDLIEEIARIYGYDRIPRIAERAHAVIPAVSEMRTVDERARLLMVDRGYQEAVTYSFIDEQLQASFHPDAKPIRLSNPIASQMGVMRRSPWPGLVEAARENLSRQRTRVRLFELGNQFEASDDAAGVTERAVIAGLAVGPVWPEQWGSADRRGDFFDIKSDVEALLALGGQSSQFGFAAASHPALHPGQCARILRHGTTDTPDPVTAGWVGTLHPQLARALEVPADTGLFVLDLAVALAASVPVHQRVSKFPTVRRDLALLVDEQITADALLAAARAAGGELLKSVDIFDIYRGANIDSGSKSIALSLILQAASR
ncbi:MAG: phenylalanine--tRNA ligase subunit beta, partial [Gammaproteobacteria bacterium]|nr:phenylalanine--tRNA ligase subunit beta [Gammaproteobacteria bacterium]